MPRRFDKEGGWMKELTKQALASSLCKLLEQRPISQVTVKDITQDCGFNRQTFYYHFQDIYDLFFWSLGRELRQYIESKRIDQTDMSAYLRALFDYFRKNERRFRHGYDPINRVQYETIFAERIGPLLAARLRTYPEAETVAAEDIDFLASFYTLSISGLIIKWIEEGMPDECCVQLDKYCLVLEGSAQTLLNKFAR